MGPSVQICNWLEFLFLSVYCICALLGSRLNHLKNFYYGPPLLSCWAFLRDDWPNNNWHLTILLTLIIKAILTLIISVFFMCCLIALYVLKSKTSLSQALWRRVFLNFAFVSGDWRVTSNRVIHWLHLLVTMLDMSPSNQDCLLHVKWCYCEVEVHYKSE